MNLLSISNLSKIGREKPLFTGVSFGLNEGDKVALIGRNGTGKSTLLNTIAGILQPDEGSVVINKDSGVSFLPQNPLFKEDETIREHIFKSNSQKLDIIREYENLCSQMENSDLVPSIQNKFDELSLKMDKMDLWNYEAQIKSILTTLGIKNLDSKMGELSGGMIKKVALAQVLVEDTKLLLLDEPTNHLDINTIYWLQEYLVQTKRSVLMVTHDRYFLDAVCNHIYELDRNKIKLYVGNYSEYLEKKQTELEIEANTERRIESVLRFERDWLLRGPCARGTKAKARIQRDMALINREKFADPKGFTFEVEGRRLGGKVLELHNISKNFPKGFSRSVTSRTDAVDLRTDFTSRTGTVAENSGSSALRVGASAGNSAVSAGNFSVSAKNSSAPAANSASAKNLKSNQIPVIKNFSYNFTKGEKIGIFGDNGSGKSTLLNIITGKIQPDSGEVILGENTHIAYYQQNPVFENLNLTVLEYIKEEAEIIHRNDGSVLSANLFLEQFGFEGKIQYSPVSSLSGGERKKLFLVRLLISNPNFLILDEPTNDFDIFTMNILEQFLMDFKACLLIVSHDRYFMDKVADTLFILEDDGSISGFVGKCSEYIEFKNEKLKEEELQSKNDKNLKAKNTRGEVSPSLQSQVATRFVGFSATLSAGEVSPATPPQVAKKTKRTFKEEKEFENLEKEITELEEKQKLLETQMSDSNYEIVKKAGDEYSKVSSRLEECYARWEELAI